MLDCAQIPVEEQILSTKVAVVDEVGVGSEGKGVWWGRWGVRCEEEEEEVNLGIRFEERILDDTTQVRIRFA